MNLNPETGLHFRRVVFAVLIIVFAQPPMMYAGDDGPGTSIGWERAQYMIPYCIAIQSGMKSRLERSSPLGNSQLQMHKLQSESIITACGELSSNIRALGERARAEQELSGRAAMANARVSHYNMRLQQIAIETAIKLQHNIGRAAWKEVEYDLLELQRATTEKRLGALPTRP